MTEEMARVILAQAINTLRAAELLETLMDGGSVTWDHTRGDIYLITGAQVRELTE